MTNGPESTTSKPMQVLRIDASARRTDSVTRALGDALLTRLQEQYRAVAVTERDLGQAPPPFVDSFWVDASFTPTEQRNPAQRETLARSDSLVRELLDADVLVMGVPLYNFSVPAALKAWIDMVARARLTFRYTDNGVQGLLTGKRAYVLLASGGVAIGGEFDFASGYLRHVLGFLGITQVEIIAADQLNRRGEDSIAQAHQTVKNLFADTLPDNNAAA